MKLAALESVVVVGGSLAGVRAGESLRNYGYRGNLTIVSGESALPYERPPLSKQVISSNWDFSRVTITNKYEDSMNFYRGIFARALDLNSRTVLLTNDRELHFDGLVIACGASPRILNLPIETAGPQAIPTDMVMGQDAPPTNLFALRTFDDAIRIRESAINSSRVVIIGAGFIGLEISSSLASLGLDVTVIDPAATLLSRAIGESFSSYFETLASQKGVCLKLGRTPKSFKVANSGKITQVLLDNDESCDADFVVYGIGVKPATEWLESSNISLHERDRGVVCDATCAVLDKNGRPLDTVVGCGDVAWFHHELFDENMRIEHFENAVSMAQAAAKRLLGLSDARIPYLDVPFFWSDLFGLKLQFVGRQYSDSKVDIVEGDLASNKFLALFHHQGVVTGALGVGRPARIVAMRNMIAQRASLDDAMGR